VKSKRVLDDNKVSNIVMNFKNDSKTETKMFKKSVT